MQRVASLGRRIAVATLAAVVVLLAPAPTTARSTPDALPAVELSDLPREAREVHALIATGGPFHSKRDGVVFGNREKLLPAQPGGYYHEYTVPTPGAANRGARRIVCGGPARAPAACWYTDDHYQSFRRIRG